MAEEEKKDDLDAQLQAMKDAEEGNLPEETQDAAPEPKGEEKSADEAVSAQQGQAPADEKPPLSPEEIEKRWKDSRAAMKAERSKRQEIEQVLRENGIDINALKQAPKQEQAQPVDELPEIPEFEKDPRAAVEAAIAFARKMRTQQAEISQEEAQQQEQQRQLEAQRQQWAQVEQTFRQAEQEFAAAVPDYYDGIKFYQQQRSQELAAYGITGQQAGQTIQNELRQIVATAMRPDMADQMHPAQRVYQVFQARGFMGTPRAEQPAQAAPSAESQKKDFEARSKAQTLSKTISGTGGKAVNSGPTVEMLNEVKSGDEFDRLFKELAESAR